MKFAQVPLTVTVVDASPRFQQGGAGHVGRSFRHATNGATRCSQGGLVGVQPLEKKREELIDVVGSCFPGPHFWEESNLIFV